ncbi:MAG: nicotinate-nucleotide--dimethylbenzimidazole phosphoribosyltransferase [Desulfatitalea sp.]|nr:nicotinate-nucleotide--dimethylbenzimidazole phosphoribosyltransferase [Desulfatitalea sp.]NNJ99901.1 nicotinate-nucleotide--dimethylbenzimidazole phosphoribosyltransferase [Desulfatitalea sp.]
MNLPSTVEAIVAGIKPVDRTWIEKARERTTQLVMPPRALGRLHGFSERCCGIQRTLTPVLDNKAVVVMAGDHGIATEGVSAFPQEVTGAMVRTFLAGGAGINAIARHAGAKVWVVDMGIIPAIDPRKVTGGHLFKISKMGSGTASLAWGPAMPRETAERAVVTGFTHAAELFQAGVDLLGTGDMGIGNTTPSAAIGTVLADCSLDDMTGRGTGIDDDALVNKRALIAKGLEINRPDPRDGLDVLAKVGGFEIGGIAGLALAGAYFGKPVVVDGFISTAGALIAQSLCSTVTDYLFAGHQSEEPGHRLMLKRLGLTPILDLGLRLGEGTGGTLAMTILDSAVHMFKEVMTFAEAGVSEKTQ